MPQLHLAFAQYTYNLVENMRQDFLQKISVNSVLFCHIMQFLITRINPVFVLEIIIFNYSNN